MSYPYYTNSYYGSTPYASTAYASGYYPPGYGGNYASNYASNYGTYASGYAGPYPPGYAGQYAPGFTPQTYAGVYGYGGGVPYGGQLGGGYVQDTVLDAYGNPCVVPRVAPVAPMVPGVTGIVPGVTGVGVGVPGVVPGVVPGMPMPIPGVPGPYPGQYLQYAQMPVQAPVSVAPVMTMNGEQGHVVGRSVGRDMYGNVVVEQVVEHAPGHGHTDMTMQYGPGWEKRVEKHHPDDDDVRATMSSKRNSLLHTHPSADVRDSRDFTRSSRNSRRYSSASFSDAWGCSTHRHRQRSCRRHECCDCHGHQ